MGFTDPLPRGHSLETLRTQEHCPSPRYYYGPSPAHFRISEWMPGGDLTEYIGKHPDANRLGLVGAPSPLFDPMLTSVPVIRYR